MNSLSPSSLLAQEGRRSTLPMQIFAMIRFGVTPEINALATIVMGPSRSLRLPLSQRLNQGRDCPANDRDRFSQYRQC
jgi:ABC-type spermidine/putrescine transport system permease subunit II